MAHSDLVLLQTAKQWLREGKQPLLVTVVQTAGSAPRPVGALMLITADGLLQGSVSGGCVEQDLLERCAQGEWSHLTQAQLLLYGATQEEARRFQLPCGTELKLIIEPFAAEQIALLEPTLLAGKRLERRINLESHTIQVQPTQLAEHIQWDGVSFTRVWGSTWTALLIGANDLAQAVAQMGLLLDYDILVCDPRVEYSSQWSVPNTTLVTAMPDDAVLSLKERIGCSCILALTHDPKLDDMALMEALNTEAFYIGALGSKAASNNRRERLKQMDLSPDAIAKLHAPIGLPIGSRTPAEIAVAIWGHITQLRRKSV
ncbi:XdhC family protein [Thiofilum flexile]|uniref:XdhC family protein n=1 Tax=Thiofilum flexile TaxID=125627 RepID=UPI0003701483|nr:XdhC family protein [Thiofilum flexile]